MAKKDVTTYFQQMLLQFVTEPDPLLSMLQWMTDKLMQMESEAKVGAEKGKHSSTRTTYFSGHQVRRFDTRLGTLYLLVPKLRNGGYIPFFVVERKRSEQAVMSIDITQRHKMHLVKSESKKHHFLAQFYLRSFEIFPRRGGVPMVPFRLPADEQGARTARRTAGRAQLP